MTAGLTPTAQPYAITSPPTISPDPLTACGLCPRRCDINRRIGQKGYCHAGTLPRVFRYGPHFGEEPPISGTRGSGAIFFSHCTLRCVYCQNHPWSQSGQGDDLTLPALQKLFSDLASQGCHNWNLVSPTPWLPQIKEVTLPLIRAGISLPFVYNSSGFELPETLDNFRELINIGLIDLRYATNQTALEGSDALNYVEVSRRAFKWFWNQLGPLELDADNVAKRGVICRLLALPNRVHEAITNLEWLARNIGNDVAVSVMAQYTPVHQAVQMPGWERAISKQEYEQLTEAVEDLGFENGWIQELKGDAPADLLGQDMPAGQGVVGKN